MISALKKWKALNGIGGNKVNLEQLKPCPFCGCKKPMVLDNTGWNDTYIECRTCGVSTSEYKNRKEAIVNWNSRAREANE